MKPIKTWKFGGFRLKLWALDGGYQVWLDTEVQDFDGLSIGHGETEARAIEDAHDSLTELTDLLPAP